MRILLVRLKTDSTGQVYSVILYLFVSTGTQTHKYFLRLISAARTCSFLISILEFKDTLSISIVLNFSLFIAKMFVVIYLISPKIYVVVPEKFVHDLVQSKLKNYGANKNQNYLIFWSENALNDERIPDSLFQPNFHLPLSDVYPPPESEACYIGRLKKFFGEYLLYFSFKLSL